MYPSPIFRYLMIVRWGFWPVMIFLMLSGCYPKPVGPLGPAGKPLTWPQMSKDQRKTHMKTVVIPIAEEIFRTWRPKRFKEIKCSLCHGEGPRSGDFRMPTNHLPLLSGDLLLRPEREKFPKTTQLKLDKLVPEMAAALGVKSFSLITRRGFGCYSCHLGPEGPMYGN